VTSSAKPSDSVRASSSSQNQGMTAAATTTSSAPLAAPLKTRVTDLLGIEYPIIQAPMGWIARSQLASAVSNAGGLGIIETSSGELDNVKAEIAKMRDLTDKPFGVNIAQAFVRDPGIAQFVIDQGVRFVTTSAGDPTKYTTMLKTSGLTVFHVVPTLAGALKAVAAGVDGLVVEGGEGGGFKNPRDVASMVLLPLVAANVSVPIVGAGGITDGASMAAAFALGAEGVQMGTRMVSAAESPVHQNWKDAIVNAAETDTVFLNRFSKPGLRALRTERTSKLEHEDHVGMEHFAHALDLYFGGDLESAIALTGQVAGRIDDVLPVSQIIQITMRAFYEVLLSLSVHIPGVK
jgi:enoyl-[acyl-carrier protein] reductase II